MRKSVSYLTGLQLLTKIKRRVQMDFDVDDLSISSRKIHNCVARAVYYEIAVRTTDLPLHVISKYIKRNHATLINGRKELEQYLQINFAYSHTFNQLCKEFNVATEAQIKALEEAERILDIEHSIKHLDTRTNIDFTAYHELLEIIMDIPEKHIQTVKTRLTPIVNMLPA
jgi:hypothetical protein